MRRLLRFLFRLTLLGLLLAAAAAAGAGYLLQKRLAEPYASHHGEADVEVTRGASVPAILDRLEAAGVLRDPWLARLVLIHQLGDPPLLAGEYRFDEPMTTRQVLDKLIRGDVLTYPVTVIEGLTLEETADALAAAGFGAHQALLREMRDPARIADLDPEAESLEGYLFPDTYSFARTATEATIVDAMVETFRRRFAALPTAAEGQERSLRELVTLASIVEKEAQLADERPIIAGVYANRLARGIGLYADPTIIFAKKLEGTWDGNLRKPDLQMDSPYNTYRYPGLPPGPICSPGFASLTAARAPADVPYIYFVSRNDGSHVFATTLAEHNRNVNEWQRRYWRRRWAEEKKGAKAPTGKPE